MSIFPLPVFEADADPARRTALTDAEAYAKLKPPTSIVVRFGAMKLVGEFPYSGDAKPGCGSKIVARTHRGTELAEMLTTTCGNSGCSKSVSRQEMLEYIENSGGREYPFHTDGHILRVATIEDLNRWSDVQARTREKVADVKRIVAATDLPMKVVDVEPIFGQEQLTVYFLSEERVDFRELVRQLSAEFHTRIEMRQVGARDEARLVADYERCGQHCCCKNFLKVLKPISMRSAKVQKATLDPLKISGRCGRLMCCLRYEDETYEDLKRRLPKNKTRVGTSEGPGLVVDSKILVQLVLVQLEHDGREIAVPVEELLDPETCPKPVAAAELAPKLGPKPGSKPELKPDSKPETESPKPASEPDGLRGLTPGDVARRVSDRERDRRGVSRGEQQDRYREQTTAPTPPSGDAGATAQDRASLPPVHPSEPAEAGEGQAGPGRRKRRRRRRRGDATRPEAPETGPRRAEFSDGSAAPSRDDNAIAQPGRDGDDSIEGGSAGEKTPRRRRRRRRRGPGGPRPDGAEGGGQSPPPSGEE